MDHFFFAPLIILGAVADSTEAELPEEITRKGGQRGDEGAR